MDRSARPLKGCIVAGILTVMGPMTFGVPGQAVSLAVAAQVVVPVHEEPKHRLVHQQPELLVLDIGFQPGDTTLFHRHDRPIAYVEIDATVVNQQPLGGAWGDVPASASPPQRPPGRVSWNEGYATQPLDHRVTAVGPGPFRLIGVVSRGDGDSTTRVGPFGPFEGPEDSGRYFSRLRTELGVGASLSWRTGGAPIVVILASSGELTVESDEASGDAPARLAGPGAFSVLTPGATFLIRNTGSAPAALSVVEVR